MKNTKRFLSLALIATMALSLLAGCFSNKDATDYTAFSHSDGIDENGFWEGIKALDHIEIFDYRAMPFPDDIHEVSDADLQAAINDILTDFPLVEKVMDRALVDGDTVNIDYVGSIDGVEFENGSTNGMGTDVTIGLTSYIDDFLEQLIGQRPGQTVNVEVTFPDDYHEQSLQGKDAVFVTTINYIVEDGEMTNSFVEENLAPIYGWTTIAEMEAGLVSQLQEDAVWQYIQHYFTTEVTIKSVPDELVKYQEKAMLNSYQQYANLNDMKLEEFLNAYVGVANVNELLAATSEDNLHAATYYLVVQAVAEDAGISVNDEDVAHFFDKYIGTDDYSVYEEQYGLPYLKQSALSTKIIEFITENSIQ